MLTDTARVAEGSYQMPFTRDHIAPVSLVPAYLSVSVIPSSIPFLRSVVIPRQERVLVASAGVTVQDDCRRQCSRYSSVMEQSAATATIAI